MQDRIEKAAAEENGKNSSQTQPVIPLPANVGQAVELSKAPEDEQAEVWQEVVETTAKPTAKAIKAVVERKAAEPANEQAARHDAGYPPRSPMDRPA